MIRHNMLIGISLTLLVACSIQTKVVIRYQSLLSMKSLVIISIVLTSFLPTYAQTNQWTSGRPDGTLPLG